MNCDRRVKSIGLLLLLSSSLIAAEPKSSLLGKIRQKTTENNSDDVTAPIRNSTLIVKSGSGRGSAFFARLWDENVIVTNAHVFLEMANPQIFDIHGREYRVKDIIASKSRDLVILTYHHDGNVPEPFVIADLANVQDGVGVTVYGNSLGDDVINVQQGELRGVGPEKIETSAPFVPGNSGGPVVLKNTNQVIGVATYMRLIADRWTLGGSEFESDHKKKNMVIRRFATRIDNLDPEDLQELDPEKLELDRKAVAAIDGFYDAIGKILDSSAARPIQIEQVKSLALEKYSALQKGSAYQWHSEYMHGIFKEKAESLQSIFKMLDISDLANLQAINDLWSKNILNAERKEYPAVRRSCRSCYGRKQLSKLIDDPDQPSYKRNKVTVWRDCPKCEATGRETVKEAQTIYTFPPEIIADFAAKISVAKEPMMGFLIGGDLTKSISDPRRYSLRNATKTTTTLGENYVFPGNDLLKSAESTTLFYVFGKLVRVQIILPMLPSQYDFDSFKDALLEKQKQSPDIIISLNVFKQPVDDDDDDRYPPKYIEIIHLNISHPAYSTLSALPDKF